MKQKNILKGKFKNKNISIEILGQSAISGEYCVQVKVLINNRDNVKILEELGTVETSYKLTKNAWYTRKRLEAIFKQYDLRR